MMSPVSSFDIQITRGINAEIQLNWGDASNEPVDITGFEPYMQFRNEYTKELYFDATDYIYTGSDPINGLIVISIPAEFTREMDFEKCGFDLLIKNGNNVYQIAKGKVYVKDTLTQIP